MANTIKIKHGSTEPSANALEEFELGYCSGNGLLYIGTNDGEVIRPKAFVTKRVDLTGQLQCNSYRRSVIALCETSATSASSGTYSSGTIHFHRFNGLSGSVFAFVQMEDGWSTDYGVNVTIETNACNTSTAARTGYGIRPCTFTYNGTNYGGVEVFIAEAELKDVVFVGESNFDIFGLDYYDTNNDSALNSEVNNSLNYTKPTLSRPTLYVNGYRYYHTGWKPTATEVGALPTTIGTSFTSGDDLDNYKTPGKFCSANAAMSGSLVNAPITITGFTMIVMDNYIDGRVIQIAIGTTENVFIRYFNGSTWRAWKRFLTNILTTSDYGTTLPAAGTAGRIFFKKV